MKTSFTFLLCFCLQVFAFCQMEWVGNHEFSESATDLVRTSQNQYILIHNGLTVFDSTGNIVFSGLTNDYPSADGAQISDIVEMSDSSLVFSVFFGECDVVVDAVVKYDKNWNELWTGYSTSSGGPAARFSDNSFIFGAGGSIEKWDTNGNQIWDDYLTGYQITDLVVTASDTALLATKQGLLKLTDDGEVVDSIPNLIFDRLEILPNGNFLAQLNDVLYLYSPDFTQLAFFQQQGEAIEDIAFDQNEIAVLTSALKIIRLDHNLTNIGTTQLAGHNQTFKTITIADGGFMVGGGEKYGSAEHGNESAFIKEFATDGSTSATMKDVEAEAISHGQQITVTNNWGVYSVKIPDIIISVKNTGSTPVDRLNLNLRFPTVPVGICGIIQEFSKPFEDINLLPGNSVDLTWGEQKISFLSDPAGPLELCFWTSLPNHHLETNNDNDVSCTEVLVAAHEPFPIEFEAYLLPSSDEVYLNLPADVDSENSTVSFFNAAGQLLGTEALHPHETLSMGHLPDGLYLLRVAFENRTGWAKVVKY